MDWTLVDAFKNYVFSLDGKDQMELVRCLGSLGGILLTLYLAMSFLSKATKWTTLGLYKGTKFVAVKSFRLVFPERKLSRVCRFILQGMNKAMEGNINIYVADDKYNLLTDNAAIIGFNLKYGMGPNRISPLTKNEGQYAHINSLEVLDSEERALIVKKLREVFLLWQKQKEERTKVEAENLHSIGLLPPVPVTYGPSPLVHYIPTVPHHVNIPSPPFPNIDTKNESPEKNEKPFIS